MISSALPPRSERGGRVTGRTVLVWFVSFFLVVFLANGAMVWLAMDSWSGLEADSAYRESSAYPAEMAAAAAQVERDWHVSADLARSGAGSEIVVQVRDREGRPISGLELTARLARPTQDRQDDTLRLAENVTGRYEGSFAAIEPGAWQLQIDAERGGERVYRSVNRITLE